ncbi:MAG TPA: hypothetical protein V6D12_01585 [Candidatus Obscuribacterales bacterium]
MRLFRKITTAAAVAATAGFSMTGTAAMAFTLSNGPGDGTVNVGVDGFGSFGSSVGGAGTEDAFYDPVGSQPPAPTSFESGLAIRLGNSGARTFLTSGDIGGSGNLQNPTVTGTSTSANSSFSFGGLNFDLTQVLAPLFNDGGTQTGSTLTQTYAITNPTNTALDFELLRYIDGDLEFDGSLIDGGGRLVANGSDFLFEIDSATGSNDPTTLVGISSEGGTIPTTGRYEIDEFSDLRSRIISGTALDDTVTGDSPDADQFIDAGNGYDVTLALNNLFSLGAGQTTTYTNRTFLGAGTPGQIINPPPPTSVPESSSVLGVLAFGTFGVGSRLLRQQQQKKQATSRN